MVLLFKYKLFKLLTLSQPPFTRRYLFLLSKWNTWNGPALWAANELLLRRRPKFWKLKSRSQSVVFWLSAGFHAFLNLSYPNAIQLAWKHYPISEMERTINFQSLLLRGLVVLTATQSIFISAVKIEKVGHIIKASSNCLKESENMTSSRKPLKEGVGDIRGLSTSKYEDLHVLKDIQDMEFKASDDNESIQLVDKKAEMLLEPREMCRQE